MPTDNHDFRQPPRGQTGWDEDWYHNFDTLDARVVARGVESDRSEYTPYQNTLYLATDTQNIFRGTGTGWTQLESYGVNPDFGQASADKVTINNAPTDPTDAVRKQELDAADTGGSAEPGVGGTYSTTGDGTATTFSWDTGVTDPAAIQYVSIDPSSRSASTDYTRFIDGTSIGVEYDVPPDDGVMLSWFWTINATVESVVAEAHDHTGDTLNPTAVNSGSASVSNAPTSETEVARKQELDTKADQDGGGTASLSNYASIGTDVVGINQTQASGRVGDYVYYDWQNKGPYIDGQDAYADVPPGGTLVLSEGTYAVEMEGPLHSTIPRHITGSGTGLPGDSTSSLGTQLRSEYVDGPVIQFDGDATNTPSQASIGNLSVDQRATTTHPVIRINNFLRTNIHDTNVTAGSNPVGILYEGDSFFARQYRNYVAGWTDTGVSVTGSGYAHEFHQTFVSSGAGTDHTALHCTTSRPIIIGGQYSAVGTGGCAIHLDGGASGTAQGGIIIEPGIERTPYPLRLGGANNTRENVYFRGYLGHMSSDVVTALDLVNARNCELYPTYNPSNTGTLVDYHADQTAMNAVYVETNSLRNMTVTGTPSLTEAIHAFGGAREVQISDFPTGTVPITVEYLNGPNQYGPAFHDGSGWQVCNSTAFTP